MAESITEGTLSKWHKSVGEFIERDEQIATVETDKVDVTVNSPESGIVLEVFAQEGDTIIVGGNLYKIDTDGTAGQGKAAPAAPPVAEKPISAPAAAAPPPPPPSTPVTKPTAPPVAAPKPAASSTQPKPSAPAVQLEKEDIVPGTTPGVRTERRVKMSRMRSKISERLKQSQNTAAALTTFNEIDMSNIIEFRKKYKDLVLDKHGIKLGFMSAFIKASCEALKHVPEVNARIEGDQIVYNDFMDVSVAVATPKGLVTPVLRNCETMSFLQIEKAMSDLGKKARDNAITIEDMAGGTFTISNGGVFGSMMGTPIINQPQSAILGMHATKDRAVVVNGQIVIRPMMYVALTYDHRLIDGREAVTFLVKVKEYIEDPRRLLLGI